MSQTTTERTLDGHPITHGLAVWDYDLKAGYINLGGCREYDWQKCCCGRCPNGRTLWFHVVAAPPPTLADIDAIEAAGGYYHPTGSLMNSERVWVVHPFTKVRAS
jgi:hypothetical protein